MDVPVTEIELDNAVFSGAEMRVAASGMVPIYEEHTARLERGYTLDQWQGLHVTEKALAIAQRRIRIAMENLQAEAEIRAAKRNAGRVSGRK